MIGKKLADIKKLNVNNILEVLGEIPENKMYLAQAAVNAMHLAVENYQNKN